jgi:hypothetical protein
VFRAFEYFVRGLPARSTPMHETLGWIGIGVVATP